MIKAEMNIRMVPLHEIKPYENNVKQHPVRQLESIIQSIKTFGFRQPIVIDKNNVIVCGHARYEAAAACAISAIPCEMASDLTEEQINAYRILDNEIAAQGYTDTTKLQLEIAKLPDFDFKPFNLEIPKVEIINEGLCDADEVPPITEYPKTKMGDVWILGNHRLMCGDSTYVDNVDKLMNGGKADIGFTSPPYNANKSAGGLIEKKYKNDEDAKSDEDYLKFLIDSTLNSIMFSNYSFINIQMLSHNRKPLFEWQNHFKEKIKDILIWIKNISPPQINKGTFNSKWEYVYCFSDDCKSRSFPCDWHGKYPNVIEAKNGSQNEFAKDHKATFSVEFPLWIIEKMDFCKTVLDLFGGTGTTLIACEKTNRTCFMMEISPAYCDIIINRWQKFSGKDAILESTQQKYNEVAYGKTGVDTNA